MSRRRVALGVAAGTFDRIANALIQLALVPILATHWGLERYGSWAILLTLPNLLALGDLGFGGAATIRMTMQVARGELDQARTTIRSGAQVQAVACSVLFGLAVLAALLLPDRALPAFSGTAPEDLRAAIVLLAAYTCAMLFTVLLIGVYRSTSRFAAGSLFSTMTAALESGLLVLVVVLGHGILGAVVALLTGRLLGITIIGLAAARLRTGLMPGLRGGSAAIRRELLVPALAIMSIPLASTLLLQGTVSALGFVAGAAAVPAFVAARTLSRIGLQATQVLTGALMPEFGAASARGQDRGVLRMVVVLSATAAAIAVPFALALAVAGPGIVYVWSNHTIHAPHAMMLAIAVSALCGALWKPVSDLMLAANRQAVFVVPHVILAFAGVGFTLLTARSLGSTAPALALALTDVAMVIVVARFARVNWIPPGSVVPVMRELWHEAGDWLGRLRQLIRRG